MWTKKPPGVVATPATALPKVDLAPVEGVKPPAAAAPLQSRHRLAGSHDGMYVTEHHRRPRRRG